MFAVELHAHSEASYDGRDSIDGLLARASEAGLDAIAVTDHDVFESSLAAVERAPEYGVVGIPGMEISSAAGHVLAIGIESAVEAGLPFHETVDRIHEAGGIAVVPHPFQEMRSGVLDEISRSELTVADAIEVYNSRLMTGRSNWQARRFASMHDVPMTAGSDAHIAAMVGRAVTRVDADELSAAAICDAIRAGRTTLETRRTPYRVTLRQAAGNTTRRLRLFVSGLFR